MRRGSDRVRRLCTASAGVGIATLTILFCFSAASAASPRGVSAGRAVAASVPALGVASRAGIGVGFGQVKPHAIGYGGDPLSGVGNVKWDSWGGARAEVACQ